MKIDNIEVGCETCRFLDEYFGDCCHPKGGGAKDIQPSMDNCGEDHNYAWWEPKHSITRKDKSDD